MNKCHDHFNLCQTEKLVNNLFRSAAFVVKQLTLINLFCLLHTHWKRWCTVNSHPNELTFTNPSKCHTFQKFGLCDEINCTDKCLKICQYLVYMYENTKILHFYVFNFMLLYILIDNWLLKHFSRQIILCRSNFWRVAHHTRYCWDTVTAICSAKPVCNSKI